MKGQSYIVTHALFVGISITFVLVVMATMNAIKEDYQEFIVKNEIKGVCSLVKKSIEKIYFLPSYTPLTNTTAGKIRASFPERLADLKYRVNFSGNTAIISAGKFNDSCVTGFSNAIGFTTGGDTEIIFKIQPDGAKTVEMVKV